MRKRTSSIRLNVILAFGIFAGIGAIIWLTSYYNLFVLEQKLLLIEKKNNLLNTVLEARRYEKNFFLTTDIENLRITREYALQAEDLTSRIVKDYSRYATAKNLPDILLEIKSYITEIDTLQIAEFRGLENDIVEIDTLQNRIQSIGKDVTDSLQSMVSRERSTIKQLFTKQQIYLYSGFGAVLLLTMSIAFFIYYSVILPLRSIEIAIEKITVGDYTLIPKVAHGERFESFIARLNHMITELNQRRDKLVQTEKMASLGILTSGVAHELNNPLNNISTSLQILMEEIDSEDVDFKRELIEQSEDQVARAQDTVKALLEFSRTKSFSKSQIRFKDIVIETLRLIKGEIPSHIQIEEQVPVEINVVLDNRKIQQTLINLIMNAVQAIENYGKITIEAWDDPAAGTFSFAVEDTGMGMSQEQISKIFDPFYTTKDVGRGSGLGLSVTLGIIEQHGGSINVASEPGKGSRFVVNLPLSEDDDGNGE